METGKLIKISNKDYHDNSEYIGHSMLLKYLKSPRYVKWWNDLPSDADEKKSTPAMQFGSAAHSFILEPDIFEQSVFIMNEALRPESDKTFASKANKTWRDNIIQNNKEKVIISNEDYQTLSDMKRVLFADKRVTNLLGGGRAELSLFTTFRGVKCKIRPDYLKNISFIDYKSTDDTTPESFNKAISNYYYHAQMAFYKDILDEFEGRDRQAIIIAQEKKPPYSFSIFRFTQTDLEAGQRIYIALLDLHKYCLENNNWNIGTEMYSDDDAGIINTQLPVWALREFQLFYNNKQIL